MEPFGDDWRRSAQVCRAIDELRVVFIRSHGAEAKMRDESHYMHPDWEPPPRLQESIEEQLATAAKSLGVASGNDD